MVVWCWVDILYHSTFTSWMVPVKRKWSCRIVLTYLRTWVGIRQAKSLPSISMVPEETSTIFRMLSSKVDLPLPVRPTIPIFYLGLIEKFMFWTTVCRLELYLSETSLKIMPPLAKRCIENGDYTVFWVSYARIGWVCFSLSIAANSSHLMSDSSLNINSVTPRLILYRNSSLTMMDAIKMLE